MESTITTTAATLSTVASSGDETSLPASSSSLERMPSPAVGDAVTMAVVAGLVVMVAWWLCGRRCRRGSDLPRRLVSGVKKEELYGFLSDPHCMTAVHPLTSAVRMEGVTEEGGSGATTKRYILVEKIPFTVESEAVMRCDPSTNTIVTDFKPVGGLLTVQVTWRCLDTAANKPSDVSDTSQNTNKESISHTTCASNQQDEASSQLGTTARHQKSCNNVTISSGGNHSSSSDNSTVTSDQGTSPSTVFENHVLVIGPRVVAIPVAHRVKSLQIKLTDNIQQYFLHHKPALE